MSLKRGAFFRHHPVMHDLEESPDLKSGAKYMHKWPEVHSSLVEQSISHIT